MPGFDGKGPRGQGEMTGGGRGCCVVDIGSESLGLTGRLGSGRRMGRGRGNCFRAFGGSRQGRISTLSELQQKFNQLQADFEVLKAKSQ
ncbi:MAG: DUF5320 domain-containing protein [Candidatus Omnitrophota bacterium]